MDPITLIAAITASLTLAEKLIPQVQRMAQKGEITPEQQREVMDKYNSLKNEAEGQFQGDHWKKSTDQ